MSRATAQANANIALVKYWGKRDADLNLPATGSLSVTLQGLETRTTVEFDGGRYADLVQINGQTVTKGLTHARITDFLDRVRQAAGIKHRATVRTVNDFPTGAGLASSASGFAALAMAATAAAGVDVSLRELSILARLGSGSAARSIFGGFVEMLPGSRRDGMDCYAQTIAEPQHWDMRCLIAITAEGEKSIGSTEAMTRTANSSIYYDSWVHCVPGDLLAAKGAIASHDFGALTTIAERSCLRMHASAMAADPGIIYWNPVTVRLIHRIRRARLEGLNCFFTIDAGAHVKVFCPGRERSAIETILRQTEGVTEVITARPGPGVQLTEREVAVVG